MYERLPIVGFFAALIAVGASASDVRDVVFECPCTARWTPDDDGGGRLVLEYALRNFRSAESAEVVLAPYEFGQRNFPDQHPDKDGIGPRYPVIDPVPPGSAQPPRESTISLERPPPGTAIGIALWERVGEVPQDVPRQETSHTEGLHLHEVLSLWPTPGGEDPDRIDFVDLLADADGDGVGDANERAAGTMPDDPASVPGSTTIDVLAVYDAGIREYYAGLPETRIHHVMTVANSIFVDTGTNVRLRTVGISEIEHDERGYGPSAEDRAALMARHGADLYLQWRATPRHGRPDANCNKLFGRCNALADQFGFRVRGRWSGDFGISVGNRGVLTVVHELGHVMGLGHSARQGETWGAFRWSRGHYIASETGISTMGTIMSYGFPVLPVFSDPAADCAAGPCGVPVDHADGANAVASLDLLRFQIAANREAQEDADGDGIVDPADAFPEDPDEWKDADADGVGDIADPDDDNDGVADAEDAFPRDAGEWADADDDGVGDNADEEVADLTPFRDAALRAAVEEALGKAPGEAVSAADMATLKSLTAHRRGIRDLTGLELATNLSWLDIVRNYVSELSPLSDLTALTRLRLDRNNIVDLSPLAGLTRLESLSLSDTNVFDLSPLKDLVSLRTLTIYNAVALADISPLSGLPELRSLGLTGSWNVDISQLAEFTGLSSLYIASNRIADVSPLRGLTRLTALNVGRNNISDLSPLSGMKNLERLTLAANPVVDISVLAGMPELESVDIGMTRVDDLSVLADHDLGRLDMGWTPLSLDDVLALANARRLVRLGAQGLGVRDISGLRGFDLLEELALDYNDVSDVAPLRELPLRRLELRNNAVSDIAPLVRDGTWERRCRFYCLLDVRGNPLAEGLLDAHVETLESWGVDVRYTANEVRIADPLLRALVSRQAASAGQYVDDPVTADHFPADLSIRINGFNAGVSDLTGLEGVAGLRYLFLGSNAVDDVSPLAGHVILRSLDLSHNLVSDLGPLVANPSTGTRRWMTFSGNPLTQESLNTHVPALREAGWVVKVDSVAWIVVADGAEATFDTGGYFESMLGAGLRFEAAADKPDLASVKMDGGALVVSPGTSPGSLTVTVTATDSGGGTASLDFVVALALSNPVPLFPSAIEAARQGFVRVVNRSGEAGAVRIDAVDDAGRQADPLILAMKPRTAAHFNSADLENGNRGKRLAGYAGTGQGDWHLRLTSGLDIDVLAYMRTADGFMTSMHDLVPEAEGVHRVAMFNSGSNDEQVSHLRIVNAGAADAEVTISGTDDEGASPGSDVSLTVPPRAARTFSAADLESGNGIDGALGDGVGKWSLTVSSDGPIRVMSLLESPGGHLTNLSTAPAADGGVHAVPLFPSASDELRREGFVRVVNRGDSVAEVGIVAFDGTQRVYEPLALTVDAGHAVHFNSNDLESGNSDKGLVGSTGAGAGDWRLELTSDTDIQVISYVRTRDGFLTSMHDVVPRLNDRHQIPIFNPGRNANQLSRLRLINMGNKDAQVTITGVDDGGQSPGDEVRVSIPMGSVRTFTAAELESGNENLDGGLGVGVGKWRLIVESEEAIVVMNLLESPTGHLTNLSTRPAGRPEEEHNGSHRPADPIRVSSAGDGAPWRAR